VTSRAVLFDIDGTLVDSNYLHVDAWAHAFRDVGLVVQSWRIHRAIGADSVELLDLLIGDAPEEVRERAKALNAQHYEVLQARIQAFPGSRELVAELASRGLHVVLATSAPATELQALLDELDMEQNTFAVTSAKDVEKAKPEPEIIAIALERGEASAADAVMVGDSVWDIEAAARAGVAAIGLLSGGTGRDELLTAGAIAVYDDVTDLHHHIDDSLVARYFAAEAP
jgi:HAD superfamily hydrolase (TIGR01509 family)